MLSAKTSYWRIFRLIFVLFSLYLLRDVFYRWDGFRYYASFSEYLPSVALITILWSIVAVFTAMLVWLPGRALEWFSLRMGWKVKAEHWVLFIGIFVLLGTMAQAGKRLIWHDTPTPLILKLLVLLGVALIAIFLIRQFRYLLNFRKFEQWMGIIQERITPLVWLFGIWVMFSVPLVAYHTWGKQTDTVKSQKISQSTTADNSRPNIILVTFDALAARDMSVYGYYRATTPFISEWAKTAYLFTGLKAESNITTPTTASLMTGKRLWTHQTYHVENASKPVKSDIENLALVLKNNDYYNMAFVANNSASVELLGISGSYDIAKPAIELTLSYKSRDFSVLLYRLFDNKIRLHDWILRGDFIFSKLKEISPKDFFETQNPPKIVFSSILKTIEANPFTPFFAWIHIYPPHAPYLPSEPYMGMYDSSPRLRAFNSQYRFRGGGPMEFTQEQQLTVDVLRARYDEFIRYCDKQFKDFVTQLTKRNKLKNTVIILSSDHGESFEHNFIGHDGPYMYEQLTHIPLIIKEPGQTEGRIINNLIEQIDIPPTILDLADIPVPSWMEGRSLVQLMRGKRLPSRPAFSMALQRNRSLGHQITKGTIAVWDGDYKLIHYLKKNKSLLFNLKEDPAELNNLFEREPEVGQRLLALIQENLKKANERINEGK